MPEKIIKTKSQYDIICKIGNIDISRDIYEISIIRTLDFPYTSYLLKLNTDVDKRKFVDSINPNMDIKLIIDFYSSSDNVITTWDIDLVYIFDQYDLTSKYYIYQQDSDNQAVYNQMILYTIPKNSLDLCITPCENKIYFNKNIKYILDDLSNSNIKYITEIQNNQEIPQYVSEKQSFINELRRLNYYYGFYEGPIFYNFDEFQNKLLLGNITEMLKKEKYITLEHVTISKTDSNIHSRTIEELSNFYIIMTDINIAENVSSFILKNNYLLRVINYPNDYIYDEKTFELKNDMLEKYSPIDKSLDMKVNNILKKKFKNYYDVNGNNYDYTNFITNFTKNTKDLVKITFNLSDFIDLESFYPGRICLYKTQHQRYVQFIGKYILNSCLFTFSRSGQAVWDLNVKASMIRTNLEY